MKKLHLPWLEAIILILAVILVGILAYPQYQERDKINKRYRVVVNMHTLQLAIENYAAFNLGKFPTTPEEFKKFFTPPINPYQDKFITAEDVLIFQYDKEEEYKNQSSDSQNGRIHGEPGGLAYGYFIPEHDSIPSVYGILGFDETGATLSEKLPSGATKVLVLYYE